jgi:hypothetical protein
MTGMLIGVAALSAWGLYRFNQILAGLSAAIPPDASVLERVLAQGHMYLQAFAQMYGDIFKATVVICVVGALLGLLISGQSEHADEEPAELPEEPVVEAQAPAVSEPPG